MPKSIKDEKLIEYIKTLGLKFESIVVISAHNNYNIDHLLKEVKQYQTSKNVYVVGHTNAGKSTLINQLLKNGSDHPQELTISPLPSTTLNKIEIVFSEHLTFIDTPGLVEKGSIINYIDPSFLKKVSPRKEIKPKTYQLFKGQALLVEDFLRVDYVEGERNSFTLYLSNDLKVKRLFRGDYHEELKNLSKREISFGYRTDLVVSGLGFFKIVSEGKVEVYASKDVDVFTRRSMI